MTKLNSFAIHRPKLINPRRKALTHHLPAHPLFRISRNARHARRTPAPPPVYCIQHTHNLLSGNWLGDREKVFRVLAFLAQVNRENLGFAVLESRSVQPIYRIDCSLCHQPQRTEKTMKIIFSMLAVPVGGYLANTSLTG